ncbi:MAG: hypothetical protein WAM60_04505 [Candidatus Promineifilaceae bacterium]
MRQETMYQSGNTGFGKLLETGKQMPRQFIIGIILVLALFAFETFNFDTTRYALGDLLGDVRFMGMSWAAILAIAFCAIDFAGLARLFTPERGRNEPKEVWYLMGAWLLGATMNAIMTWWAVSLTLLNHNLGNEVLSRDQLLHIVPVFVAILVWLTRILFIGAVTVAGERLMDFHTSRTGSQPAQLRQPAATNSVSKSANNSQSRPGPRKAASSPRPDPIDLGAPPLRSTSTRSNRVRQRPPRPGNRPQPGGFRASSRR